MTGERRRETRGGMSGEGRTGNLWTVHRENVANRVKERKNWMLGGG